MVPRVQSKRARDWWYQCLVCRVARGCPGQRSGDGDPGAI